MPLGLAAFIGSRPLASGPCVDAGLAAARGVVRRAGYTLAACHAAAWACRRGDVPGSFDRAAAATWFRAESTFCSVSRMSGSRLALATWSPGAAGRGARRVPAAITGGTR